MAEEAAAASSTSNVQVFVRVRPFRPCEEEAAHGSRAALRSVVRMQPTTTTVLDPETGWEPKESFVFDYCFWSAGERQEAVAHATQLSVYDVVGPQLLDSFMAGYNACLFAYGQTGSGKTYTMMGNLSQPEEQGIIPRLCRDLFQRIHTTQRENPSISFKLEASYMEIYMEKVRDLLVVSKSDDPNRAMRVLQHPVTGPFVEGLSSYVVPDFESVLNLLLQGDKERTTAATNMNDRSSRSHAILSMTLSQLLFVAGPEDTRCRTSKIHLVDLAGSERVQTSGVEGRHFKEATAINQSLSTLGRVIDALLENTRSASKTPTTPKTPSRKQLVPPYRDSTLTFLLSESLGGNSKTFMMATISPYIGHWSESYNTLRYAARARRVVNIAVVNEDSTVKIVSELRAQVERLAEEVVKLRAHEAPLVARISQLEEDLATRGRPPPLEPVLPKSRRGSSTDCANCQQLAQKLRALEVLGTSLDRGDPQEVTALREQLADAAKREEELQRQLLEKDQELFKAQEAHAYQRDAQEAEAAEKLKVLQAKLKQEHKQLMELQKQNQGLQDRIRQCPPPLRADNETRLTAAENDRLRAKVMELQAEAEEAQLELQDRIATLEMERTQLAATVRDMEHRWNTSQMEAKRLQMELDRSLERSAAAAKELQRHAEQTLQLSRNRDQWQAEARTLQSQLDSLAAHLEQVVADQKADRIIADAREKEFAEQVEVYEGQLTALQTDNAACSAKVDALRAQLLGMEAERDTAVQQTASATAQMELSAQQQAELQAEFEAYEAQVNAEKDLIEARVLALKEKLEMERASNADLRSQLEQELEACATLQAEKDRFYTGVLQLSDIHNGVLVEKEALEAALEACKQEAQQQLAAQAETMAQLQASLATATQERVEAQEALSEIRKRREATVAEMQNDVDLYRAEVVAVAAYLHATLAAAEVGAGDGDADDWRTPIDRLAAALADARRRAEQSAGAWEQERASLMETLDREKEGLQGAQQALVQQLQLALEDSVATNSDLSREKRQLMVDVLEMAAEKEALQAQVAEGQRAAEALEGQVREQAEALSQLQAESEAVKAHLSGEMEGLLADHRAQLERLAAEQEAAEQRCGELQAQLQTVAADGAALAAQFGEERQQLEAQVAGLAAEKEALQAQVAEGQRAAEALEGQVREQAEALSQLQAESEAVKAHLSGEMEGLLADHRA
eukprot:EG_transcript_994